MHLQNRVTPFGEIVAISQRGMFTGNRGIIHDPVTKTLLTRRWATKAWYTYLLSDSAIGSITPNHGTLKWGVILKI